MNVKLFVTNAGRILLTCDHLFKAPIEKVVFNFLERELFFKFEGQSKAFSLNCHVDDYIARFMAHRHTCGIGFLRDEELIQAVYVPLDVIRKK